MNKNLLRAPIELASRFNKNTETQTASYRSDFMRDRDRIMYCNAFRRLDGKTQIYLIGSDDHRRNRLTHTRWRLLRLRVRFRRLWAWMKT